MSRTTIDFGIDLGTTNSAIAVLKGVRAEVVKNNDDQDVTPSAVSYGKSGQLFVGTRAKNISIAKPHDAYGEFKRRMGTNNIYTFKSSGLKKKPEALSAEVLKSLRADVARSALAEEIQAAVITVPAAFELHQCDATRRAAELAGFKASPLLQEPVAAALAYGFQIDDEKAYWLVYDFGGGTFDVALIKAEEGVINVVHHGGDNFLGGTDIDWAILESFIIPQLVENHDLPDFKRGNDRWELALLKLKRSVELAKIELTTKESTTLTDCVFEDASGEEVDCEEVTLTQRDVISTAEPIIRRSTDICRIVLKEKKLSAPDVQRLILVGGPTKAPYFRDLLKSALGIPIDFSMDPLTVVAKGAAVFAGTQKVDAKLMRQAKVGEYRVEMLKSNKTVGHEIDPLAGGKVSNPDGASVEGFTIELVNTKTQWRSGKVALGTGYEADGLRARVSDFGLAKKVNPLTLLATAAGTPHFKPPEAFSDEKGDSCSADVWAIGTTLYLLLTDQFPFKFPSDLGWGTKNLFNEPVRPATDINPDVNPALDRLISKSLDAQPSRRFQNAVELLDALDEWKPRSQSRKPESLPSQVPKTALGEEHSSPNEIEASEMARKAIVLKKEGRLADAADVMEEAFNKSPNLRDRYAHQVRLWRCGVSM
jgi:actin-like ATPase involved in cell morphogenesis